MIDRIEAHDATLLPRLELALGRGGLLTEDGDLTRYENGWRYGQGKAWAAVRPTTTEEVALVMRLASEAGVPVQVVGGNTGLVAAATPTSKGDQLVLSTERLNRTVQVDPIDRTVLADAGATLSQLNAALEPYGLWFPVDLGADPQLGGMVATNTGGTRCVRYGDVRRHLLGVEVVLPDGTVVSDLKSLRKDNTGLDLKQLFCGTSGSYGVITRVRLSVEPLPAQRSAALVALSDGEAVLELLAHLERNAGEVLSAFEVLSAEALEMTLRHGSGLSEPFGGDRPTYTALVEFSSTLKPKVLDLSELLEETLADHVETVSDGDVLDAIVGKPEEFWHLRHQVSESLAHAGRVLALDLSVPRSQMARFTRSVREMVAAYNAAAGAELVRVGDFGHWGDGGTHLNLFWDPEKIPGNSDELAAELQAGAYEICVREYSGSFSAEHGVGPHNQAHYARFTPTEHRAVARTLKLHFDPEGRLGTVHLG